MAFLQSVINKIHTEWVGDQGVTVDGNGDITSWDSIRGSYSFTVEPTYAAPSYDGSVNGLTVPKFDDSNNEVLTVDSLPTADNFNYQQDYAWNFISFKLDPSVLDYRACLLDAGGGNTFAVYVNQDVNGDLQHVLLRSGSNYEYLSFTPISVSEPILLGVRWIKETVTGYNGCEIYVNGALYASDVGETNLAYLREGGGMTVGVNGFLHSSSYFSGEYLHLLNITGDLTTNERENIEQEIASKWGITSIAPTKASGTVKFSDAVFSNGVVDFFSAPSPTGTLTLVDSDVAITSGVATMTTERDPLKDYFGVARGMTQDFTGTLTAVAGTTLSTGLNLTGVSIGGANGDHYIFRATAGAGAGEEVTVLSRTGGDIVVNNNPGFDATTEFTLGRFVRGISRVFPKD